MKLFKTKLDAATIVLIPACIGINYLGKLFASFLKLPLWLDSIGTCIGGCLGGPVIGALCGAANNLIYGFTAGDNITLIYALTSLGIGLAAGIMARLGFMKTFPGALVTACVAGFVAVLISTPLNGHLPHWEALNVLRELHSKEMRLHLLRQSHPQLQM